MNRATAITRTPPRLDARRIGAIARYTVLEAWRNRLFALTVVAVTLLTLLSLFARELAVTESGRLQTAILAATLRVASVFLMALYILNGLTREFNDKVLELMLSLDLPRPGYLMGKFLGFAIVALAVTAIVTVPVAAHGCIYTDRLAGGRRWRSTRTTQHSVADCGVCGSSACCGDVRSVPQEFLNSNGRARNLDRPRRGAGVACRGAGLTTCAQGGGAAPRRHRRGPSPSSTDRNAAAGIPWRADRGSQSAVPVFAGVRHPARHQHSVQGPRLRQGGRLAAPDSGARSSGSVSVVDGLAGLFAGAGQKQTAADAGSGVSPVPARPEPALALARARGDHGEASPPRPRARAALRARNQPACHLG